MKDENLLFDESVEELEPEETGLTDETAAESGRIIQPFDPDQIQVTPKPMVLDGIVRRIDHNEVRLDPDFQRSPKVWDHVRKSQLIESLLLRIPLPVFYVASDPKDVWEVVDGLQRLSTIHSFVKNGFELKGMEYLVQFDDKRFEGLPRNMQRRIEETQLFINVIEAGTPEPVKYNIFKRINTGGMPLTGQEIRNALNPGRARRFLKDLIALESFSHATSGSVSDLRMGARECALRFVAFYRASWRDYNEGDLGGFLNDSMAALNRVTEEELVEIQEAFEWAMHAAFLIFQNEAFRKPRAEGQGRRPVSKALFEAWSVCLSRLTENQFNTAVRKRLELASAFAKKLKSDPEFVNSISYSTGSVSRVQKRFETIEKLIDEVVSVD